MTKISVEIPDELGRELREFNLDVSKIVSRSIRDELIKLMALRAIANKSKMTMRNAIELGRKVKKGRFEELKRKGMV